MCCISCPPAFVPIQTLVIATNHTIEAGTQADIPIKGLFDQIFPSLEAAAPNDYDVLCLKGTSWNDIGWDARSGAAASNVTPDQFKAFADDLAIAEQALTKAYDLDPSRPYAPTEILDVELGQGKGKNVMEMWFKRAMEADPDNVRACNRKLLYLQPKWYGSSDEMLAFGHECLDGGNYHAGIPSILVSVHAELAKLSGDESAYYHYESVWQDIDSAFTGLLARYPDNDKERSYYALCAFVSGKWAVANEQFDRLGDKVDASRFGGPAGLAEDKQKARDEANHIP